MKHDRVHVRESMDLVTRVRLLENDMDRADAAYASINQRLGKILWSMVGLLISVATACIVLLVTAGVGK